MGDPTKISGEINRIAQLIVQEKASIPIINDLNSMTIGTTFSLSQGFGQGLLRIARAKYSFAVDGGAQGAITPATTATLPINAVIIGGTINSTTAVTSGGAATVAVGTTAGSSATSLLGVTGKASLGTNALVNSVATFAAPVKMSAAGSINITIGTADLLTGIIEITVLYFVAGA